MGNYLNNSDVLTIFESAMKNSYYIDKSELIGELFEPIDHRKSICIARPRRFGKTTNATMIGAFLSKGVNSRFIFDRLKISHNYKYNDFINKYNVFYINMSEFANDSEDYQEFISMVKMTFKDELYQEFPNVRFMSQGSVSQDFRSVFNQLGQEFIFIFDEWDCIFYKEYMTELDRKKYISFLVTLTKDQAFAQFTYMTGVLPIAKYSSGSSLNNFDEYTMASDTKYGQYFGFTDIEVDELFARYIKIQENPKVLRDDLDEWYDGYCVNDDKKLYNSRSIVKALSNNKIESYWTKTGGYNEIANYILADTDGLRSDILSLIVGESVKTDIFEYSATSMKLDTKAEIFSAMVVYGFLSYKDGCVRIPNKELLIEFKNTIKRVKDLNSIQELISASEELLKATLNCDSDRIEEILDFIHTTEAPLKVYNNEAELSAIIKIAYITARSKYDVEQEDHAGKGYVDFIFYPRNRIDDGIILELKVGKSPKEAINQIYDNNYPLKFVGKLGEPPKTIGRVIIVGINSPKKTKKHQCLIEVIDDVYSISGNKFNIVEHNDDTLDSNPTIDKGFIPPSF